jgi:hypothetical protein
LPEALERRGQATKEPVIEATRAEPPASTTSQSMRIEARRAPELGGGAQAPAESR